MRTITGAEIVRVKNVHFCGEHTSLDAQGYMEGGALTGAMAATEVAEDLRVPLGTAATRTGATLAMSPELRILARARAAREHRSLRTALRRWKRHAKRLVRAAVPA